MINRLITWLRAQLDAPWTDWLPGYTYWRRLGRRHW
jgi:hypothetical protein